ncbi:MAG: hypothetical protein KAW87_01010 [Candidatus Cloacimonetes bacterium]|nr:hypothetical protein [Candidatus Cloacimonadota bacterium]
MKAKKGTLNLIDKILIFQSTIPIPDFSFLILSPRFPIKLGTGIAFLVSPSPQKFNLSRRQTNY